MRYNDAKFESALKSEWRPMLDYLAELHARSVQTARPPFAFAWEEIGPGYCYGPAFGHWDIVHQCLDQLPEKRAFAANQLFNLLALQRADGWLPGAMYIRAENSAPGDSQARAGDFEFGARHTHPPVWPVLADEIGELELKRALFGPLLRQIGWFERERAAPGGGFYYLDIGEKTWESGVDEGIRFDDVAAGARACVDATSHVCWLYQFAAKWARELGEPAQGWEGKNEALKEWIARKLWCDETGFFHDIWAIENPSLRVLAVEGYWPLVVGAATPQQARRVANENLLNSERFFAPHPLSTVALCEPKYEARMWRGPAWNSQTMWAAHGLMRYDLNAQAKRLLEAALDSSARVFERTGTIWEFYGSRGGAPTEVARKPDTPFNAPCRDYLGHNPLRAMAQMWAQCE